MQIYQEILPYADKQPYHAFVNLYAGDVSLSPIPPQYMQSFTVIKKADNAGTFKFAVFDRAWEEVENLLQENYSNISFQYGHVTGRQSLVYTGMVTKYSLDFQSCGVVLSAEGAYESARGNFSLMSIDTGSNKPSEAFVQIAAEMGWQLGRVDETNAIELPSTETYKLLKEHPMKYIVSQLIPQATRASDGKSGYRFILDDSTTPPTASFYPPEFEADEYKTYVYQKGVNSSLVNFRLTSEGVFGGGGFYKVATQFKSVTIDPLFKSKKENTRHINDYAETTGEYSLTHYAQSVGIVDSGGSTVSQANAILNYEVENSFPYNAQATIVGDPSIKLTEPIRILIIKDNGMLHNASGIYTVMGITDTIYDGTYLTNLQLTKTGVDSDASGMELINYRNLIK